MLRITAVGSQDAFDDRSVDVIYGRIEAVVAHDHFYDLERTFGSCKFQLANRITELLWFQMLVCIPILSLMAIPAVWLIRRYR